jgi:cytochrome c biogenesis factor
MKCFVGSWKGGTVLLQSSEGQGLNPILRVSGVLIRMPGVYLGCYWLSYWLWPLCSNAGMVCLK